MGSPVQEIFQGRGDKKRQGYPIKRGLPLLLLVFSWLGLVMGFAVSGPAVWFSFSLVTAVLCSTLHFISRRKEFSVEFLYSLILILGGVIQASALPWLKLAYFPAIVTMAAFYGFNTMVPISVLLPFLGLKTLIEKGNIPEEAAFSVSLVFSAVISTLIFDRLRKERERAVTSLAAIKDNASEIGLDTGMESLGSEESMSHYFASVLQTDEEIMEMLYTVKHAVLADSVNLFIPGNSGYSLRCSTEHKGDIIITGKGIIPACIREMKAFASGEIKEKETELGYIKDLKVSSLIATPVMAGGTAIGVLSADSSRYQAFSGTEKDTVKMFAGHIARIMERERVYVMIKRETSGLRILQEESSALVASLNIDVVAAKLCEGAGKIAPSQIFFFMARGKKFELIHHTGEISGTGKFFDLKGTFINMAVENKLPIYLNVNDYHGPVVPFRVDGISYVFAMPMFYENSLLGLFVMLLRRKDSLSSFQQNMLKVICNQASTSIANAKLHAEIEKLATTDGLTGLLNHRVFQEKLSEELRRQNRFAKPVSLLLTDIDYFKKVNDTYGHPAGDLVLKDVARIIRDAIREVDIPARYGGEEFAVILPGTSGEGATNIAERLRKAVMDKTFSSDGRSFQITISLGIAISPSDAMNKEELIEKADQALYHAKHHGRNQTVLRSSMR